jgi:hypothetical protein
MLFSRYTLPDNYLKFFGRKIMAIKPTDAKKLAIDKNTIQLNQLISQSDEMMRMVMEAGDMVAAEQAAQSSAEAEAALIIRKKGIRDFAQRVRERVEEGPAKEETSKEETPAEEAPIENNTKEA